jgi:RNA polymerase sigma-70 factor (ECF subfamily)
MTRLRQDRKRTCMQSDVRGVTFLRLFVRHQQEIYAYILTWVPNLHDADDLFQEGLTVMWNKFDQFEEGTHFVAWAVQIMRYLILDHRRRLARSKAVQLSDEVIESLMDRMPSLQDQMEVRLEVLNRCMDDLDPRAKRMLKMRYERNVPVADMASRLQISVRQIQRSLASINGILLRCMRRRLATGGDPL